MNKYELKDSNLQYVLQTMSNSAMPLPEDNNVNFSNFIRELCLARDAKLQTIFSRKELCDTIAHLCTA